MTPADTPVAAPVTVRGGWAGLHGIKARLTAHDRAMAALSVACHKAAREHVVTRAADRAKAEAIRAAIRRTLDLSVPSFPVRPPADWTDLERHFRDTVRARYEVAILDPSVFAKITAGCVA